MIASFSLDVRKYINDSIQQLEEQSHVPFVLDQTISEKARQEFQGHYSSLRRWSIGASLANRVAILSLLGAGFLASKGALIVATACVVSAVGLLTFWWLNRNQPENLWHHFLDELTEGHEEKALEALAQGAQFKAEASEDMKINGARASVIAYATFFSCPKVILYLAMICYKTQPSVLAKYCTEALDCTDDKKIRKLLIDLGGNPLGPVGYPNDLLKVERVGSLNLISILRDILKVEGFSELFS